MDSSFRWNDERNPLPRRNEGGLGPTKSRLSTQSEVGASVLRKSSNSEQTRLHGFLLTLEWRQGRVAQVTYAPGITSSTKYFMERMAFSWGMLPQAKTLMK